MLPVSPGSNVRHNEEVESNESTLKPSQVALNHLTTITTWSHSKLARILAEGTIKLYEGGCWTLGRQALVVPRPHRAGLVIGNAGQGVGKSLCLRFAEAGYSVFALIHPDLDPSDDGSIANLIYVWQQHRAAILDRRNKARSRDSTARFPELGTVIPLPFAPSSQSSRTKVCGSVKAYCEGHQISLHAVILTPAHVSSLLGKPESEPATEGSLLFSQGYALPHIDIPTPREGRSDLTLKGQPPERRKWKALPSQQKGSHHVRKATPHIPLAFIDQSSWEKAVQRDITEQLLSAQTFLDLLASEHASINENLNKVQLVNPQRKRKLFPSQSPETQDSADGDRDSSEEDEVEYSSLSWLDVVIGVLGSKLKKGLFGSGEDVARGRIVLVCGGGDSSFRAFQGVSGPANAARKALAENLNTELSGSLVHACIVEMGPVSRNTNHPANAELTSRDSDPQRDPVPGGAVNLGGQIRRPKLLAKLSSLWAIEEEDVFWIAQKAVEARYPRAAYTFGLDVPVRKAFALVPNTAWEFASWIAYERLGGGAMEEWMLGRTYLPPQLAEPLTFVALTALGWVANGIRRRDQRYGSRVSYA